MANNLGELSAIASIRTDEYARGLGRMKQETQATAANMRQSFDGAAAGMRRAFQGMEAWFKFEAINRAIGMVSQLGQRLERAAERPNASPEMQQAGAVAREIREDIGEAADGFFARVTVGLRNLSDWREHLMGRGAGVRAPGADRIEREAAATDERFRQHIASRRNVGNDVLQSLRTQLATLHMTADEAVRHRLQQEGATQARLNEVRIAQEQLSLQRQISDERRRSDEEHLAFRRREADFMTSLREQTRPQGQQIRQDIARIMQPGLDPRQQGEAIRQLMERHGAFGQRERAPLTPNLQRDSVGAASVISESMRPVVDPLLDPLQSIRDFLESIDRRDAENARIGAELRRFNPPPPQVTGPPLAPNPMPPVGPLTPSGVEEIGIDEAGNVQPMPNVPAAAAPRPSQNNAELAAAIQEGAAADRELTAEVRQLVTALQNNPAVGDILGRA